MGLYVGTSGYSYKPWKGSFYPKDLPDRQMLRYYGEHFRTVEINNTFFAMPKASTLEAWAESVPANFQFVLKAPRHITFAKAQRRGRTGRTILPGRRGIDGATGPLLFQLPPNLKKDANRLQTFLA